MFDTDCYNKPAIVTFDLLDAHFFLISDLVVFYLTNIDSMKHEVSLRRRPISMIDLLPYKLHSISKLNRSSTSYSNNLPIKVNSIFSMTIYGQEPQKGKKLHWLCSSLALRDSCA